MRKSIVLLAALLTPSIALAQLATQLPVVLNSTASTDGASVDENPSIATDGAGNWVSVWLSGYNLGGTIGTDRDVFVSRSTDNALTWSSAAVLNSSATSDGSLNDGTPSVYTDGAGTWLVVWHSTYNLGGTTGGDFEIFYSRSVDNGDTWSAVAVLNSSAYSDGTGEDTSATLAWSGGTNWIATWQSTHTFGGTAGTDPDVAYATSSDGGLSWSAPALLNSTATTDGTSNDFSPSVKADTSGNAVTVWASAYNLGGTIGTDPDIFAATSSDNGLTWSSTFVVNSSAATDGGNSDFDAVLVTDRNGVWIASWRSQWGATGGDNEILCARSTNNGASWNTSQVVNSTATTDSGATDTDQRMAASGANVFAVVWVSALATDGNSDNDILVSTTNDGGLTWSKVTYLHDTAYSDSTSVDDACQIAGDGAGAFVSLWRSVYNLGGNIGTDTDIFTRNFTPDFTAPDAVAIVPAIVGPTNADSVAFTVTFNQDVTGFDSESDLQLSHLGTTSSGATITGGPATYTVTVNNLNGDGTFTLAAATGTGVANNLNVALGSSVTSTPVSIDNTAPGINLSTSAANPVGGAFTVTVLTDEPTIDFDASDLLPSNASIADFSGASDSYSFTLVPSSTPCSVSVNGGVFSDSAGNLNSASNLLSRDFDGTFPSVSLITPALTGPTQLDDIAFTVTFDEPVLNFNDAADLLLNHSGTTSTGVLITGGPTVYDVTISGIGGDGFFTLAANTGSDISDLAANPLSASITSAPVNIDNTAPQFTQLLVTPSEAVAGEQVSIAFESSEPLLDTPEVTVNGAPATGSKTLHGYQYLVSESDPIGPASIVISGIDEAGNTGLLNDASALQISVQVPVAAWPAIAGIALAAVLMARKRRP